MIKIIILGNEYLFSFVIMDTYLCFITDMSKNGRTAARSEVNILLCGDPGTSKSQLLQYVHKLVPRGQYTSGKGSSAAGLTASVIKDPETGQLVLQTGALGKNSLLLLTAQEQRLALLSA